MDAIEVTVMMVLLIGTAAGLVTLGRRFWWHPSTGPVTVSAAKAATASSAIDAQGKAAHGGRAWAPAVVLAATAFALVRRRKRRKKRRACT